MDALTRIAGPARDLLGRVDAVLVDCGAPAAHPVWSLLRRAGALPGELVEALVEADPDSLHATGGPLRAVAQAYTDEAGGPVAVVSAAQAPGAREWQGPAAAAFAGQWRSLAAHLAGAGDSMAGRLRDTARYAEEVADWLAGTRRAVAVAVAECLGSVEATTLRSFSNAQGGGPSGENLSPAASRAAAALAAHVLRPVAAALDEGEALRERWSGRLGEVPYRPEPVAATGAPGRLVIPG